jgi:hypothetical protein
MHLATQDAHLLNFVKIISPLDCSIVVEHSDCEEVNNFNSGQETHSSTQSQQASESTCQSKWKFKLNKKKKQEQKHLIYFQIFFMKLHSGGVFFEMATR